MKKLLIVLLAFVMVFAFAACGETNTETTDEPETITSLEVGGDFEPIDLTGKALGEYTKIDIPEWYITVEGDTDEMYYCEGGDKPYIAVNVHPIDTDSFEDAVADQAKQWGTGYYQMINDDVAYMAGKNKVLDDGTIYYIGCMIYNFGDSIKTVIFYGATEEVQVADSDIYFNILKGYNSKLSEEDEEFGASVYAEYDDTYFFPSVYACYDPTSYEQEKEYFSFLKEFNMTEEQYNKWLKNWDEAAEIEYLNSLGFEVVYQTELSNDDFNAYVYCCTTDNYDEPDYETFTYIERDGKWYLIETWTKLDIPCPNYANAILDTIHVKK